jgi:hypothetical protein
MVVRAVTSSGEANSTLTQSPLWPELLDQVQASISGHRQTRSGPSSLESTASAVARAHSRLLVVLERDSDVSATTVSELLGEAVELLACVARVGATFAPDGNDGRDWLSDQLNRRLAGHEDAVLAGEVTYSVWSEQTEQPATRMREANASLARDAATPIGALVSLRVAAVELAALLIRAAANAKAVGRAGEAPEVRPAWLGATLNAITTEVSALAQEVERPMSDRADVAAHHLAAGLRVRLPRDALRDLRAGASGRDGVAAALVALREAWLLLATNEYVAVGALDSQLAEPAYDARFGGLDGAIAESAPNVICGARLLGRPAAFRHRRAWCHQSTALTYALAAYIAGLRGHAPSLAQAQLIALTRLARATVAIAMIDRAKAQLPAATNGPES